MKKKTLLLLGLLVAGVGATVYFISKKKKELEDLEDEFEDDFEDEEDFFDDDEEPATQINIEIKKVENVEEPKETCSCDGNCECHKETVVDEQVPGQLSFEDIEVKKN